VLLASESVNAAAAVTILGEKGTLLQHAVYKDCPDVVRVLLTDASVEATINAEDAAGWDINAPLLFAAELGRVECLQALLACAHVDIHAVGHDNDEEPVTPLGLAGKNGHLCCVRALLAADGIDVNCMAQDENGEAAVSALMEAAYTDQVPCLLALLGADGININLQDADGWTALAYACNSGSPSAAEALLAVEGIDASLASNDGSRGGYTPLHFAAIAGKFHTVQLLLQRKEVNANAATTTGMTPLHYACDCYPSSLQLANGILLF
jgi:ankyrin repeat protein